MLMYVCVLKGFQLHLENGELNYIFALKGCLLTQPTTYSQVCEALR